MSSVTWALSHHTKERKAHESTRRSTSRGPTAQICLPVFWSVGVSCNFQSFVVKWSQSHAVQMEIIVIDDGSDPPLQLNYEKVHLHRPQRCAQHRRFEAFSCTILYHLVSSKWCENGQYLPHLQYMCIENTIPIIQYQYISISTVSVGSSFSSLMNQWIGWLDGGPYPSTIHNAAGAPPNWWSMNQNKTIKSHCVQEFGVPKKVARNEITKWIQMIHSLLFTLLIE